MKKFRVFAKPVIFLLALALSISAVRGRVAAAPAHDVLARTAVLYEMNSGQVLYEKDMRARRAPDNLVKVMTLLVAVRACEAGNVAPDDYVTAGETAWDGVDAGDKLRPGERMSFSDLMYMAYFGVDDAACNAVAEHVAGSVGSFVEMMNGAARELGCEDTKFTNTHGRDDPEQYTTAWDLAVIMTAACGSPLFVQIAGTFKTTLDGTNYSAQRDISSPNQILNDSGRYYYRDATAARTSGTYENGYGLVASAARDDVSLIGVILGAVAVTLEDESTQMQNLTEGIRLFEWGFGNFGWRSVLSASELIAQAPVEYGDGADGVLLRPSDAIELLIDNDIDESAFSRDVVIYSERDGQPLTAPIESGAILGEITVYMDGKKCGSSYLVANTGVELQRIKYIEDQVWAALGNKWVRFSIFIVVVLFAVYIALVIRYNRIRRARLRRIKEAKQRIIDERRNGGAREEHDDYYYDGRLHK